MFWNDQEQDYREQLARIRKVLRQEKKKALEHEKLRLEEKRRQGIEIRDRELKKLFTIAEQILIANGWCYTDNGWLEYVNDAGRFRAIFVDAEIQIGVRMGSFWRILLRGPVVTLRINNGEVKLNGTTISYGRSTGGNGSEAEADDAEGEA